MPFMSSAWETTPDDILNVIHDMGKKAGPDKVHEIDNLLDHFAIEDAALKGDSMEEQVNYAYEEIKKQITEGNMI